MPGMRDHWPLWEESTQAVHETYLRVVAGWMKAYFSALQTEGVVLVAAPPCKACGGKGYGVLSDHPGVLCPCCNGTGLARMVALDDVVEWLRAGGDGVRRLELARLVADDIERHFSGESS